RISIVGNFNARQHDLTRPDTAESPRISTCFRPDMYAELCLARKGSRIDRETLRDRSRTATAVRCRPPKWISPETVEACTMRSRYARDTEEVRSGVPGGCGPHRPGY